ncbi:MAG: thiol peroxidase [Candidatus Eremiobacteraeota bacterium]|nr:thiol peroxidase [Candidatus Eremiobacteraeota bacterium]
MATQVFVERTGIATFHGDPLTLVGPELHVGDAAPDFSLVGSDMKPVTLESALANATRSALLIVVPSLDTPTCSVETQTFHKRLDDLPGTTAAFVVSLDLPFAQQRWAGANDASQLAYLSDYKDHHFGPAYGVLLKEIGLLARSVFLIRPDGKLAYVEIVKEISDQPDYDAVFAAVNA